MWVSPEWDQELLLLGADVNMKWPLHPLPDGYLKIDYKESFPCWPLTTSVQLGEHEAHGIC